MVNARELRIGNFVNVLHPITKEWQYCPIKAMSIKNIEDNPDHELIKNNFAPIELSPEILDKCGFVKRRDGEYLYSIDLDKHISIVMSKDTFFPMLLQDAEFSGGELSVFCCNEIQYLHQLQNLVHALTGEELTVNL